MATLNRELWAEAYKVYQSWGTQLQAKRRNVEERAALWGDIVFDIGVRAGTDKQRIALFMAVYEMLQLLDPDNKQT